MDNQKIETKIEELRRIIEAKKEEREWKKNRINSLRRIIEAKKEEREWKKNRINSLSLEIDSLEAVSEALRQDLETDSKKDTK